MIDVLMSTYNGSRFLREQIDSILGQSHTDLRLMIRDDGSVDDTREIAGSYAKQDARVQVADDKLGNLGARRSFMRLIENSDAEYFMLADQDDVWLPGKIESSFRRIAEMEKHSGAGSPLLVFTDLKVVDAHLAEISPSMWRYQRLDPAISRDWRDLLAQNVVTGCTIIANRAAGRASLPFALPEMMHDHWLAVNAAKYGHVEYIDEQTVLYRQHEHNVEGGRKFGLRYAGSKAAGGGRIASFRRAAGHFGNVSAAGLMFRKIRLNLRRLAM